MQSRDLLGHQQWSMVNALGSKKEGPMPDQMRVLLVDDDPFTRVMLTTTLQSLGCEVVADAGTVPAALRAAHELRPRGKSR